MGSRTQTLQTRHWRHSVVPCRARSSPLLQTGHFKIHRLLLTGKDSMGSPSGKGHSKPNPTLSEPTPKFEICMASRLFRPLAQAIGRQGCKPEFPILTGISDFNFTFTQNHMPAALSCQARVTVARVKWRIAARLAVSLTCLVDFSPPTGLAGDTCPDGMTSECSIHRLPWFASRSAAAAPQSFAACCQNAGA